MTAPIMSEWASNEVMAFASVVNVLLVGVLAFLNYRYVRSAAEQAKAAREQAVAALDNIKIVRGQIQEQRSLKLTEALVDFRRLQYVINFWLPRLEGAWGAISSFPQILPDNWPSMFHIVEQSVPSEQQELLKIENHVRNAEMIVNEQLQRKVGFQYPEVFKAAANDLAVANRALTSVLDGLEAAFPERSRED
jgi:hypothetical protein